MNNTILILSYWYHHFLTLLGVIAGYVFIIWSFGWWVGGMISVFGTLCFFGLPITLLALSILLRFGICFIVPELWWFTVVNIFTAYMAGKYAYNQNKSLFWFNI